MILDIDKFKKFRRAHDKVDYSFHNINEMLTYFIKNGYLDIEYFFCRRELKQNVINVVIKTNNRYFGFVILLDDYTGIYRINYDLIRLGSDLHNRYNKLLRIYKVNLLTDIDLDI